MVRSLVLALGVCYLARLEDDTRVRYAERVSAIIKHMIHTTDLTGADYLFKQIDL